MPERTNKAGMSGVCHASTDGRPASSMPVYATTTTPISTPRTPPGTANFSRRSHISSIFAHANTAESAHATASDHAPTAIVEGVEAANRKNARSIRPRSASKHTTESPSTIAHAAHARAKNSAGKSQRRAARRGEFSTSSNESTASAPPPVLPRNRYATMSESNMPMRFPSPLANDVTLPHVATLSQFVASSIAGVPLRKRCSKKSPECPARSRCISDKCTATAKKPALSSRLFVSDPRCMKSLRTTDSQPTRWQQPWCWWQMEQLPSSRRCERECSRTQRPRCCATR